MHISAFDSPANWNAAELESDRRWIFTLDDRARRDLAGAVSKARDPEKTLLAPVRQPALTYHPVPDIA